MRLRYLHLPRCGPLEDVALVFGQEDLLFGHSPQRPAGRRGAINFVVGVNGTGKSTLLRAVYHIFRSLKSRESPGLPVTIAWDWTGGQQPVTAVFHQSVSDDPDGFFAVRTRVADDADSEAWETLVVQLDAVESSREAVDLARGPDAVQSSLLQAHLPPLVMAYTSGDERLWEWLEVRPLNTVGRSGPSDAADDRPPIWSIEREWEEERPVRVANIVARFTSQAAGKDLISPELSTALATELAPMARISRKVIANQLVRAGRPPEPCVRIRAGDLRLAGTALAIWQSARELGGKTESQEQEKLRSEFLEQIKSQRPGVGARRILNELDWFRPTHLSLVYRDVEDRISKAQREQLLCLCALAEEVVAQPLDRVRVVVSLGPAERIGLTDALNDALTLGIPSQGVQSLAERVDGSRSGAEAVLRLFSETEDLDKTLADLFAGLKQWQDSGLLEDVTLVVNRLRRPLDADGQPEDAFVLLDHFSDGEQMLLGRMALLFLLAGQDGSLLLIDEPETHFNDLWKREIIDLIDENVLQSTAAQIVVATHTSLALTDVFKSEIVLLERDQQTGEFFEADEPIETFGASPADILRDVFRATETIGQRAAQFLDLVLVVTGQIDDAEAVWKSGDFSGEPLDRLWQAAQFLPYSFRSREHFADVLKSVWSYTKSRLDTTGPPRVLDTLKAIEEKLGPGHYQYEFRRRIYSQPPDTHAAQD